MNLDDIKQMLGKITKGKWYFKACQLNAYVGCVKTDTETATIAMDVLIGEDAEFIAAAPEIVAQLLDEVERLKKVREEALQRLGSPTMSYSPKVELGELNTMRADVIAILSQTLKDSEVENG